MLRRAWREYWRRHAHPANRAIHAVAVPITFLGAFGCAVCGEFNASAICFFGGYLAQFVGHAIEGNDAGEVVLIKRWFKQPFVEFAPRSKSLND